uniref:Uncharacterized protein n=1 Tax=Arundo donax TaxID=35708 RepID=A0A0A8ZWX0_ARUDO
MKKIIFVLLPALRNCKSIGYPCTLMQLVIITIRYQAMNFKN